MIRIYLNIKTGFYYKYEHPSQIYISKDLHRWIPSLIRREQLLMEIDTGVLQHLSTYEYSKFN